jgi:hypothetical protein
LGFNKRVRGRSDSAVGYVSLSMTRFYFEVATDRSSEFLTDTNANIIEDWLRFTVYRTDDRLELAKERLIRGLKKYIE